MADVEVVVPAQAPDGRGTCCLSGPIHIPEEFIWGRLVNKVYNFHEYFRTVEYSCKELPDGKIYRDMVVDDPVKAPKMGRRRVIDLITVNKEAGVVEFILIDNETEKPKGDIRYNILHRNPLRIEYSEMNAEGVKNPLSNGDVIKQQIKEAYDVWQESLKAEKAEETAQPSTPAVDEEKETTGTDGLEAVTDAEPAGEAVSQKRTADANPDEMAPAKKQKAEVTTDEQQTVKAALAPETSPAKAKKPRKSAQASVSPGVSTRSASKKAAVLK